MRDLDLVAISSGRSGFVDGWSQCQYTLYHPCQGEHTEDCQLEATSVHTVHLLNINDTFAGLLLHIDGRLADGQPVQWEAHVMPRKRLYRNLSTKATRQLNNVKVDQFPSFTACNSFHW